MDALTYPATVIVHWPSGPVPACGKHGQALVSLGNFLGSHIVASPITYEAECENCKSEARSDDERVPRPVCRACKNGAHMECWGCGCACNADEDDDG